MAKKTPKKSNSRNSSSAGTTLLALLAFGCIGGAGWMGYEVYQARSADRAVVVEASELSSRVEDLAQLAEDVVDGGPAVIDEARALRLETGSRFMNLRSKASHLETSNPDLSQMVRAMTSDWSEVSSQVELLESFKQQLSVRFDLRSQITDQINTMEQQVQSVSEQLVDQSGSAAQVFLLSKQGEILRDIRKSVIEVGDGEVQKQASLLKKFGENIRNLLNGGGAVSQVESRQVRGQLAQVAQMYSDLRSQFQSLYSTSSQIDRARKAVDLASRLGFSVAGDLETFVQRLNQADSSRPITAERAFIAGVLGLVLLVLFIVTSVRSNAERAKEANVSKSMLEEGNRRRQEEMQKLVSEIHPLTARDLTTEAAENGAFTKQIAQVFNKAISSLRDIVNRLQHSSIEIATAAEQSHRTSENLKSIRKRNEQTLGNTSNLAQKMDKNINKIHAHASETAQSSSESAQAVAAGRKSVEKTHRAVEVADTSIRVSADMVKKLGEEIQQIESIAIAIREIVDNLQSLSYNTQLIADRSVGDEKEAISATADKMESLARTVFGSLEEITHIVTGISGRAAETQAHIEKSGRDFVDLVQNSNTTLRSFELIGDATSKSHENVRQIESEAQQLTTTSQRFIDNLTEIQNLSRESSAATEETTAAINKLADLAKELKDVSSKFRTNRASGIERA